MKNLKVSRFILLTLGIAASLLLVAFTPLAQTTRNPSGYNTDILICSVLPALIALGYWIRYFNIRENPPASYIWSFLFIMIAISPCRGFLFFAMVLDYIYRRLTGNKIKPHSSEKPDILKMKDQGVTTEEYTSEK